MISPNLGLILILGSLLFLGTNGDNCTRDDVPVPIEELNERGSYWPNIFLNYTINCEYKVVKGWYYYAKLPGKIHFGIWRSTNDSSQMRLIGETVVDVTEPGEANVTIPDGQYIAADVGDMVGVHYGPEIKKNRGVMWWKRSHNNAVDGLSTVFQCPRSKENLCLVENGLMTGRVKESMINKLGRLPALKPFLGTCMREDMPLPVEELKERPSHWSSVFLNYTINCQNMSVKGWQYYAKRAGQFHAGIWRKTNDSTIMELVGETVIDVAEAGYGTFTIPDDQYIDTNKGDMVGIHYGPETKKYRGVIPFKRSYNNAKDGLSMMWQCPRSNKNLCQPENGLLTGRIKESMINKLGRLPGLNPILATRLG